MRPRLFRCDDLRPSEGCLNWLVVDTYKNKKSRRGGIFYCSLGRLFRALCGDEFAVEASDVAQRYVLGAFGCASTGVGAVAEAEFVHLAYHCACAALAFNLTLGQQCELAYLGRYEEHCGAVLAGSDTCAAADAGGGVHSGVGNGLADGGTVCVGSTAAVEGYVAAGLLNLIESITVDCKVADYGECRRAPGLDGDGVAIVELTHVELAGCDTLHGAVGMAVDIEGAHAADAFAAVIVEYNGFFAFFHQLLVEHVQHFKEAGACGNVVEGVVDELSFFLRTTLTPNFQFYADCMFHFRSFLW